MHAGFPRRRRRGAARRGRRPARRRSTPRSSGRRAIGRAHGARTVRVAADEAERALLLEGPQVGVRRDRPHRARTTTSTTRSCPARKLVEVLRAGLRDRRPRTTSSMMNVFHAGDGNLHPLLVFDRARAGRAGAGARRRRRDHRGVRRRRRRAVGRARHRAREARRHAADVQRRRPRRAGARCATRSTPTASPTRRRCCPPGRRCGELQRVPEGAWI